MKNWQKRSETGKTRLHICKGVVGIVKIKCCDCGKTLMYVEIVKGEIKCPRCGTTNRIEYPAKGRVHKTHH